MPRHVLRPFRGPALLAPVAIALATALTTLGGCAHATHRLVRDTAMTQPMPPRQAPFVLRALHAELDGRWIGNAIAYGPFRDGQAPWGAQPTREQVREDLRIIARHWNLIRLYGAVGAADTVLSVIREERLPIRVIVGAWLAAEDRRDSSGAVLESFPAAVAANLAETEAAVRLANEYHELVVAVSVGNETQVAWSDHRMPVERLVRAVRSVRARTRVPVTTADDYNFWNKPASRAVADEVDFVFMHLHPLWNGILLDDAMDWTAATCAAIRARHPDRELVVGEVGWATAMHPAGEQGRLIKGAVGEAEQKRFVDAATAWAESTRTVTFLFEAFDENWKGGPEPAEVEKHWGLYRADRTPKLVMQTGH